MIVLLEPGASREVRARVLARLQALGLAGVELELGARCLIHVTHGHTRRARHLLGEPGVQALVPTSGPRVRRAGRRFYPFHSLCSGASGLVLLGALVLLAGFFPPGVAGVLAPGETAPAPHWPWYLAPARGLLRWVPDGPAWLGPSLLVALLALLLSVPLFDRSRGTGLRARAPALAAGLLVLAACIALGVVGGRA